MKPYLTLLLFFSLFNHVFSQNSWYNYFGKSSQYIKQGKIKESKFVTDILPGYHNLINFFSTEISVDGKNISSRGTGDTLNQGQKSILFNTEIGSIISIKVTFSYKDSAFDNLGTNSKIKEIISLVTIIPEVEAEYPGGQDQMQKYLIEKVTTKITPAGTAEKVQNALLKFTIGENGNVMDAKIIRSSTDPEIDAILIEAINAMPKWKPAENELGKKIKREISFPFGGGC